MKYQAKAIGSGSEGAQTALQVGVLGWEGGGGAPAWAPGRPPACLPGRPPACLPAWLSGTGAAAWAAALAGHGQLGCGWCGGQGMARWEVGGGVHVSRPAAGEGVGTNGTALHTRLTLCDLLSSHPFSLSSSLSFQESFRRELSLKEAEVLALSTLKQVMEEKVGGGRRGRRNNDFRRVGALLMCVCVVGWWVGGGRRSMCCPACRK